MVHQVTSRTELLSATGQAQQDAPQQSRVEQSIHHAESKPAAIDEGDLKKAVDKVREVFQSVEPRLRFEIDPDLDRVIVKIMNGESGEVIRQIPPQEVLNLAKSFRASPGLLLQQEA